jgi:carbonic anhydrase
MPDISKFIDGISRFQQQHFGDNPELADQLSKGQKPLALLIGCSDSRVDPALLTDCAPGDLFMIRNVANLVPPYEKDGGFHGVSSALEYAVCFLQVEHIIVMGHSQCGGINGLMSMADGSSVGEFISKWVNIAAPARDKVLRELPDESPEEQAHACEKEAILISLRNLQSFPWVKDRISQGKLMIHGWYYNLGTGQLKFYNQLTEQFEVLVEQYSSDLLLSKLESDKPAEQKA